MQGEADTWLILRCLYESASENSNQSIVVRLPNTDVFILLLHYSPKIKGDLFFDTGSSNKRYMISIKAIAAEIGDDVISAYCLKNPYFNRTLEGKKIQNSFRNTKFRRSTDFFQT